MKNGTELFIFPSAFFVNKQVLDTQKSKNYINT